jgi:DNA invertase Pin-like site-specific DNA recombinase
MPYSRIATYTRVSKEEQARDSDALNRMLFFVEKSLEQFASPGTKVNRFIDKKSGFRDVERENYDVLMEGLKEGKYDLLIAYRIDRITRKAVSNATIAEILSEHKTHFYDIVDDRIYKLHQSDKDWEDFVTAGVKAESEARVIRKRVRLGLDYRRQQGKHLGKIPNGYIRVDGQLIPDEESWDLWRRVIEVAVQYDAWRVAAREVHIQTGVKIHAGSLRRWIFNPLVRGLREINGEWKITHTALLTDEEYQTFLEHNQQTKNRFNNRFKQRITHLFSGIIFCGYCGGRMAPKVNTTRGKDYIYYVCSRRREKELNNSCIGRKGYGKCSIKEVVIEAVVLESLLNKTREISEKAIRELQNDLAGDPEVVKLNRQIKNLKKIIESDGDPNGLLVKQVEIYEDSLNNRLKGDVKVDERLRDKVMEVANNPVFWLSCDRGERKRIYCWLIQEIRCGDSINVTLRPF